jgi:hypothetical protein
MQKYQHARTVTKNLNVYITVGKETERTNIVKL